MTSDSGASWIARTFHRTTSVVEDGEDGDRVVDAEDVLSVDVDVDVDVVVVAVVVADLSVVGDEDCSAVAVTRERDKRVVVVFGWVAGHG